jgi:hypothetical protein
MLVSHPEGQNVKVRCEHLFLKLDITQDGVGQGLGSVVCSKGWVEFLGRVLSHIVVDDLTVPLTCNT